MGWTFCFSHTRRKHIIEDITRSWSRIGYNGALMTSRTVAKCYRGNPGNGVLWHVREWYNHKTGESTDRIICCDLLRYDRRDMCWGNKSMEELMGPHIFNCPLSYLRMVPMPDHKFARDWRRGVAEHHYWKQKKKELAKV